MLTSLFAVAGHDRLRPASSFQLGMPSPCKTFQKFFVDSVLQDLLSQRGRATNQNQFTAKDAKGAKESQSKITTAEIAEKRRGAQRKSDSGFGSPGAPRAIFKFDKASQQFASGEVIRIFQIMKNLSNVTQQLERGCFERG